MRISAVLCTAGLMLLARGAAAQDVNYDYDQRANFAAYRTYAWVGGTTLADDLNHARIVAAVDRQLAAKGLARVDSTGNPDVLVVYRVGLSQDLEINGYDNRWAVPYGRPELGPGGAGDRRHSRRCDGRREDPLDGLARRSHQGSGSARAAGKVGKEAR